jgi:hypothetical protein
MRAAMPPSDSRGAGRRQLQRVQPLQGRRALLVQPAQCAAVLDTCKADKRLTHALHSSALQPRIASQSWRKGTLPARRCRASNHAAFRAAQCTAHARAPAQEAGDIAVQGRERLRVRGVARRRAGLPAGEACERSARTRCPPVLALSALRKFAFLIIASQCCLAQVRAAASAKVPQLRPARAAVLGLLSERAPAPAPRSWPAAPPRPPACRPSPGSPPGPPHHTLALAQAAWQAAVRHERSQSARVYLGLVSRLDKRVVHRAGQALGLCAELLLDVLELHQGKPLNAAATKQAEQSEGPSAPGGAAPGRPSSSSRAPAAQRPPCTKPSLAQAWLVDGCTYQGNAAALRAARAEGYQKV